MLNLILEDGEYDRKIGDYRSGFRSDAMHNLFVTIVRWVGVCIYTRYIVPKIDI